MGKRASKEPKIVLPEPIADEDAALSSTPKRTSKSYHFRRYAAAFANGISRAIGGPFSEPTVRGGQDPLVKLCNAHAEGRRGDELLEWISATTKEFRLNAPENEVKYHGGWSPRGLQWWLDNDKPMKSEPKHGRTGSIFVNRA